MLVWSLLFVATGICFLAAAYYFSHYKYSKPGTELARGLVTRANKIPEGKINCFILSVTFTRRSGEPVHFQETKKPEENWYAGMPVLVLYTHSAEKIKIIKVLSFRQAYAKAFILSLAGILCIVIGASLL